MDRKKFYAALRRRNSGVFGTRIGQNQVKGIEGLLDAFVTHGDGDSRTLAYGLATAYHETGSRMVPVREGFAKSDAQARRIIRRRRYGKPVGPYGHVYYGRGHVQLTWEENYINSSKDAEVDLQKYPDKALDPLISARILWKGLLDGRWNGSKPPHRRKPVQHYLHRSKPDLRNARRTVNILDKWSRIAGYYRGFYAAIQEAGGVPKKEIKRPPPPPPITPQKPPVKGKTQPAPQGGFFNAITTLLSALFGGKK